MSTNVAAPVPAPKFNKVAPRVYVASTTVTSTSIHGSKFTARVELRIDGRDAADSYRVDMRTLGPWEAIDHISGCPLPCNLTEARELVSAWLTAVRNEETLSPARQAVLAAYDTIFGR